MKQPTTRFSLTLPVAVIMFVMGCCTPLGQDAPNDQRRISIRLLEDKGTDVIDAGACSVVPLVVDDSVVQLPIQVLRHRSLVEKTTSLGETQSSIHLRLVQYEIVSKGDKSFSWSCWVANTVVPFAVHHDRPDQTYASYVDGYSAHIFKITQGNEPQEALNAYLAHKPEGRGIILNAGQLVGLEPFRGTLDALHSSLRVEQVYEESNVLHVEITGKDLEGETHQFMFERRDQEWHLLEPENQ